MVFSERHQEDVLFFFDQKPEELALYHALEAAIGERLPQTAVKVQKSQISFYGRHLFAAASLPVRRRKDWPKQCLVVTIGLPCREVSPRVAVAVEPYPGRWTHHILLSRQEEIDAQLLNWLQQAWEFSESKTRRPNR